MLKNALLSLLAISILGCSSESGSGSTSITVNPGANAWVSDADQNDNYTLLDTECGASGSKSVRITLYFASEYHGNSHIIETDFSVPRSDSWVNGIVQEAYPSSLCSPPSIRACKTNDLLNAKANCIPGEYLYGCGGECTFRLLSSQTDDWGDYTQISIEWDCTNILNNRLMPNGPFGSYVDRFAGKAECNNIQ